MHGNRGRRGTLSTIQRSEQRVNRGAHTHNRGRTLTPCDPLSALCLTLCSMLKTLCAL